MNNEQLRELGTVERESRPAQEWDQVLEGRTSAKEAVERGRARGEDVDTLEALAQASAPLTGAERKAWARRARAALRGAEDPEDPAAAEPDGSARKDPSEPAADDPERRIGPPDLSAPPVDLAEQRARRRWGWGTLGGLAAVAAALVLWLRVGPTPPDPEAAAQALPSFTLVVRNALADEVRGADEGTQDGPAPYRTNSRVHWTLQPDEPIATALELAAIITGDSTPPCLTRLAVSRATGEGVLEVRGTLGEVLGLEAGRWDVDLIVARTGALPDDAGSCSRPRDLPCPCPVRLSPGARIEPTSQDPPRGPTAWRRLASYELRVDPR